MERIGTLKLESRVLEMGDRGKVKKGKTKERWME